MRKRDVLQSMILLVLAFAALPTVAGAGSSFDYLFSPDKVANDTQLFLNLAVGDSGLGRSVIEPVLPRLSHHETDLPVALFVARQSGRSLADVVDRRNRGTNWSGIFHDFGVPYDTLYAGIDRDPGPPYGKAWGYWRKNPHGVDLNDRDIRGLVQVQTGSRVAGVPAWDLAHGRGEGHQVAGVVADKRGRSYAAQGHAKGNKGKKGKGH